MHTPICKDAEVQAPIVAALEGKLTDEQAQPLATLDEARVNLVLLPAARRIAATKEQVVKHGPGTLTLTSCHFTGWAAADRQAPCIRADGGRLVVSGCEFMDAGKRQVVLDKGLTAATIFGCLLRGAGGLVDRSRADVQTACNTVH